MARRRQAQGNQRSYQREDIYRNFIFSIPRITGINQTLAPNLIADDEFQEIWNFLPTAKGSVRKIRAPKLLVSTSAIPIKIITHPLNGQYQGLVAFNDGSVAKWDGATLTQIANAGTLSTNPALFDWCVWQNQKIYIVDYNTGYFKWDGSRFSQVSANIKGTCITVWQGRIFIGKDSQVTYSVALRPEDFVSSGSGYFDLAQSFPALKLKVKKIVPYVDSLLIYGDSAIMALTGSTISNDPSTWYLTQVTDTIGIGNANNCVPFGNEVWLQNEKGLFRTTISAQSKFDYKVDVKNKIQILNYQSCIANINNLQHYLLPARIESPFRGVSQNILAFCIDTGEFFFLDIGRDVYGLYWSYVEGIENRIYALCNDGIYALFEGDELISGYLRSKKFDFGKPSLEKNFWIVMLPVYFGEGETKFQLKVITDKGKKMASQVLLDYIKILFINQRNETIVFTQGNLRIIFYLDPPDVLRTLIFLLGQNGVWGEFVLQETSNASYELTSMHIRVQLGRDVF